MALLLICSAGMAGTVNVADWSGLQAAINGANAGDTVSLAAGTYTTTSGVNVNKAVIVNGNGSALNVSGSGWNVFSLNAAATLTNFNIVKSDKASQSLVLIGTGGVTVSNCSFSGQYVAGDGEVARGLEVAYGSQNLLIEYNTFTGLRQPGYFNGSTGAPTTGIIRNNLATGTRGWVMAGAQMTFTGNNWASRATACDIALLSDCPFGAPYDPLASLSANNNNALISDQRTGTNPYRVENLTQGTAYTTIQAAVTAANAGDTIKCAAGTYAENVTIGKALTLVGAGDGDTETVISISGILLDVSASDVTIKDLRLAGGTQGVRTDSVISNLTLDGVTVAGNSAYGLEIHNNAQLTNCVITNSTFTGNANAIRVRGALDGLTVTGGHIDANGFGVQSYVGTNAALPCTNITITGTTFANNTTKAFYFESLSNAKFENVAISGGTHGADVNLKYGDYSNIEFKNATITGCGTAISAKGRNDTYGPASLSNVTITGGSITNCGTGLSFGNNTTGIKVDGTTITPAAGGVGLSFWSLPSGAAISSLEATVNGPAALGVSLAGIPSGNVDLGDLTLADNLTEFIRLTAIPAAITADATGVTFGTASTDALKEAKVYHDVDDAALGHVDWGQGAAVECSLVASNVTGTVGQTIQLSAKLTSGGNPLAGQSVAFLVADVAVSSGTTDGAGVAAVPYPIAAAGDKTITAKFSGVSNYKATTGTGTLTVNAAAPTAITLTIDPTSVVSGGTVTCTVAGNNGVNYTDSCTYYVQYGAGGSWSTVAPKNIYTAAKAGTWNVTAVYNTLTDSEPLTVTAAAATSVTLTPATATINSGATQTYVVTATDAAGNVWTPAATCLTEDGAGSFTDYTYTATGDAGTVVTITATVAPAAPVTATLNVNALAGAGTIIAWDKDTRKFYLCSNATNPQSGTEITGSGDYSGIAVVLSGGGTNVTVTAAGASLRVQWYLRSGNLYKAYQYSTIGGVTKTATFDGSRTLVDGTWKTGFWGLTHTISGGAATYGSAQQ